MHRINVSDFIGQKRHKLTCIGEIGRKGRRLFILVRCECGVEKQMEFQNWNCGSVKTCGCEKYPHEPVYKHPLYPIWVSMKQRCYNQKHADYHNYGARGVIVCDEWKNDFLAFRSWAQSNGWSKGLQLDKDKKARMSGMEGKEYSPAFCCFLTAAENSQEKRQTKLT